MSDFDDALARCRKAGVGRASDAEAMAGFCADTLQILVGAVSPKLVWNGAMKKRLNLKQLAALCHSDPLAVAALQGL